MHLWRGHISGMEWLRFRVEVPRGSFLKREGQRVEYLSPFPCPFNYGSLEEGLAADGDAPDVVLLGARVRRGALREAPRVGRVRFRDNGLQDDKLVASYRSPGAAEKRRVELFFRMYAPLRGLLNRLRGQQGETRYEGTEWEIT